MRESCYKCHYKGSERVSDLTLADAWCINEYDTNLYNEMGTSLLVIHTLKGKNIFNQIKSNMSSYQITEDYAINSSYAMFRQPIKDRRRKKFIKT